MDKRDLGEALKSMSKEANKSEIKKLQDQIYKLNERVTALESKITR